MTSAFEPHRVGKLKPLSNSIIVEDMSFSERQLSSGVFLLNDNGTTAGIRPRWGRVYAIGPEQKDVNVGQWVCVAHGRWTRGVDIDDGAGKRTIRKIDPNDILLVSDQQPEDDTMSQAVQAQSKDRF